MALIRQDRSILGEEKEDRERQQVILSDNQDKDLFVDSLVEVKEYNTRFKYGDWRVALSYFEKDAYMFSFDLKSGYHHVEIASEHQTFLGFSWKFHQAEGCQYFAFSILPFGLSTAPYIFTKCVPPLEKYWRLQGVK